MAVAYEVSEGIATLTLNRPERLNAFNDELVRGALKSIEAARVDPAVKALVITGNGRGFCAGADLAGGLAPTGEGVNASMRDLYNPLILAIDDFPKPTIAAINGVAAGAGVGLALVCDIAVAARSASFVLTFGPQLGLVPDLGVTWFLPRAIGRARARALALLGDKLPAEKAAEWGLVWTCVDDAECLPTARALAARLGRGSAEAFFEIRRLMDRAETNDLATQLDAERETQIGLIVKPAFMEGVKNFLAKKAG
ncbi:enoyl-CoA hydratase-related protein [Phreatobacter oligotrophus]|jgi:2-(1,2-epoxy-1,2-dihydrophenyl)acetyl-CoA isomerase|uniref:enoyl-CoA hydratase-related protein n=1 Tax=Phreatobacter oligotrophus TaxID=1122261 RepID=UPI00235554DD|nr:enoyl-CoA hydratase-related protein [Phreatobacter oligotrophus]MBX9989526.1 enoyl-CoA hydratase/isomerase family protein [Phreatobacter oligotrophus]